MFTLSSVLSLLRDFVVQSHDVVFGYRSIVCPSTAQFSQLLGLSSCSKHGKRIHVFFCGLAVRFLIYGSCEIMSADDRTFASFRQALDSFPHALQQLEVSHLSSSSLLGSSFRVIFFQLSFHCIEFFLPSLHISYLIFIASVRNLFPGSAQQMSAARCLLLLLFKISLDFFASCYYVVDFLQSAAASPRSSPIELYQ